MELLSGKFNCSFPSCHVLQILQSLAKCHLLEEVFPLSFTSKHPVLIQCYDVCCLTRKTVLLYQAVSSMQATTMPWHPSPCPQQLACCMAHESFNKGLLNESKSKFSSALTHFYFFLLFPSLLFPEDMSRQ